MSSYRMRSQSGRVWVIGSRNSAGQAAGIDEAREIARALGFELLEDEQTSERGWALARTCRRCGLAPSSGVGDGLCDFCGGSESTDQDAMGADQ